MSTGTIRVLAVIFLIAHGWVHYSLTRVPPPQPGALRTPFWPSPKRDAVDSRWLAARLGLPPAALRTVGYILVLLSAVGFTLAGILLLAAAVLPSLWILLAGAAAILSLALLVLYGHPWLVLGVVIDLAILAGLIWKVPAPLFGGN